MIASKDLGSFKSASIDRGGGGGGIV